MRTTKVFLLFITIMAVPGCNSVKTCSVTIYGSDYMTYNNQHDSFNQACIAVLSRFNNSLDEKASGSEQDGKNLVYKHRLETKDEQGYGYIISSVGLANKDTIVTIETTNPDKFELINDMKQEFEKRGFKVKSY